MKKIILLIVMVLTYTVVNANDNKNRHKTLSYKIIKMKKNIKARVFNMKHSRKYTNTFN
jgi:hypothetical protein